MTARTPPSRWMTGCLVAIGWIGPLPPAPGPARAHADARDVAELRDGSRATGALAEGPDGAIAFLPEAGGAPIPLDRIARVLPAGSDSGRGPAPEPRPFILSMGFDERLSGRLIGVDEERIRFALGGEGPAVEVDRRGASSLVQRPGEAQVLAERFEGGGPGEEWTIAGPVEIGPDANRDGSVLRLEAGDSEARLALPEPIEAGRLEFAFPWEGRRWAGHRWFADLIFEGPIGEEITRVVLGWADEFPSVESRGGPEIVVQPLILEPGWHRLSVRFGPGRSLLAIDGNDLGRGSGTRGSLVAVRLRTEAAKDAEPPSGLAARIDDLIVVRSIEPTISPEVDPTQDEIRLVSGDQVWGAVEAADEGGIRFRVLDRPIDLPWSRVAGVYFRRDARPSGPISGPFVRVEWEVGDPEERPDRIEGALVGVADEALAIATPHAGTIAVPRASLRQLEILGRGTRAVLDPYPRHLGDQLMPELDPPMPDGDTLELAFTLDSPPDAPPSLVIDAVHVEGEYDGGRFAEELRAGFQRTNLRLNGEVVDHLNRHVRDSNRTPARLRIPLPADRLREGSNVLRFEQLGREKDPSYRDDLGLLRIALEWPEPAPASP